MPFFTPTVTTEADSAFTFMSQQCTQLRLTARGLSNEQARSTPTASPLSIAGLIAHVAQVLNGWLQMVKEPDQKLSVNDFPAINARIGLAEMYDGSALPDLDIADVLSAFDRAVDELEDTRRDVAEKNTDLGAEVTGLVNPWMPDDFDMTVRWILWHLGTEIARHAGHADIIRESIDGAIAYQLNAEADGEPWPPEGMDDWS
ncbi:MULTISPECIES: DUF664 domain-containing protein [unclassified Brevibacterium]|uniref:mycothiol transferase n=1 Tax=unclassified Brevibacterium TaxID=2614124 RepID=UPI0010923F78|nr:DUF664 domain-containing protein [Brevibacterium sp. S22]TGD26062.1 DUF664 domain-containing protein [Brevibacterium sp. S22]